MEKFSVDKRVVAAAIRDTKTGKIYSLPAPNRHRDVIRSIGSQEDPDAFYSFSTSEEGFLLDSGEFVDRHTAWKYAIRSGQVDYAKTSRFKELNTEMLW